MPVMIGWSAVTGTIGWRGAGDVRDHLLLDAAAHLGAGDEVQGRLRRRRGADASPVGRDREAGDQAGSWIYTWLTVAATLALIPAAGWLSRRGGGAGRRLVPGDGAPAARRGAPGESVKPLRLFLQSNNYLGRGVRGVAGRRLARVIAALPTLDLFCADGDVRAATSTRRFPGGRLRRSRAMCLSLAHQGQQDDRSGRPAPRLQIAMGPLGLGQRIVPPTVTVIEPSAMASSSSPARQANSSAVRVKCARLGRVRNTDRLR